MGQTLQGARYVTKRGEMPKNRLLNISKSDHLLISTPRKTLSKHTAPLMAGQTKQQDVGLQTMVFLPDLIWSDNMEVEWGRQTAKTQKPKRIDAYFQRRSALIIYPASFVGALAFILLHTKKKRLYASMAICRHHAIRDRTLLTNALALSPVCDVGFPSFRLGGSNNLLVFLDVKTENNSAKRETSSGK